LLEKSQDNSATAGTDAERSSSRRSGLFTGVLCVIAILLVIALFLPATRTANEAARRAQCSNQLRQIGIALRNYHSSYGMLPPAYTVDEEGNRLHSWRTLLLPYLGYQKLYSTIDLSKPWDDPANARVGEKTVDCYWCPSAMYAEGLTTYLGIVGPDCVFKGADSRTFTEVSDEFFETMAVIDAPFDNAVPWMSPNDIGEEEVVSIEPETHTNHPGMVQALLLDRSVTMILLDSDPVKLRAMMTIAGGEEIAESVAATR